MKRVVDRGQGSRVEGRGFRGSWIGNTDNNLNSKAEVAVKTQFGKTKPFVVQNIVDQGSVLGPVLCGCSTQEHCSTNKGVNIGPLRIRSLLAPYCLLMTSLMCPNRLKTLTIMQVLSRA